MSNQNGPIVFTATPEMASQMKVFKAGATYIAQRAGAVHLGEPAQASPSRKAAANPAPKKVKPKMIKKQVTKKASKPKAAVAKKVAKKVTKAPKASKREMLTPDIVVKFVRENEGCNMTDIEQAVNHPQATIRRVLGAAREDGSVRTEGQRRGLRYFVGASTGAPQN